MSLILAALLLCIGCSAPSARLPFPAHPVERSQRGIFYDVHGGGWADFALLRDERGKLDMLAYDDAGHGKFNRKYRLSEYANENVPHLIILLDSVPYQKFVEAYGAGRLGWFDPPQKVIPPFPSMTELIFTKVLRAPPLPGMIDQYYDPENGGLQNDLWERTFNDLREPWERRLNYTATELQSGLAYLDPRPWLAAELELARDTLNKSPNHVTIVYFASASCIISRYGEAGLNELIDAIERLCLRVLYDRQGAIKISICADHGHNLMESKNVRLDDALQAAGFHPAATLNGPNDYVLEINGLVTYAAVRTHKPDAAARALTADPRIDLATYMDGERVIVRNAHGAAAIECRRHRVRYVPIDCDVLHYRPLVTALQDQGKADPDGYASDEDWFAATLNEEYPDAPRRLWDAFHGTVVHPPDVMVVIRDGYCAGNPDFEKFIHMASTHGGLNQVNSATFVMTMTGRVKQPMKSKDILATIEPGYRTVVK